MGTVVRFERRHARTSFVAGRGTSEGQLAPSGHRSENQSITSSYLRAVNVFSPSSSRSKKRQSPAASRPTVDKLTERASAYACAQESKLDLSSVSMSRKHSRKIPTVQAKSVGKFLLAQVAEKSDKSAMPAAAQIRATIREALANRSIGEIEIVTAMKRDGYTTVDRTYLSDFLKGKKQSLSFDFTQSLADFLRINVQELRVTKPTPGVVSIRNGAKPHLYVMEHMEARGWDEKALAARMDGISLDAVRSWIKHPEQIKDWQLGALLHAFAMDDIADLARPPIQKKASKPKIPHRKRA